MKLIELFEIEFIDNTKLWATINEENNQRKLDTISFGILGNGINIEILNSIFRKCDNDKICYIAEKIFNEENNISKIVKKFTDKVKENSDRIENQLIAKNKEKENARRKKQLKILNCDFMINEC